MADHPDIETSTLGWEGECLTHVRRELVASRSRLADWDVQVESVALVGFPPDTQVVVRLMGRGLPRVYSSGPLADHLQGYDPSLVGSIIISHIEANAHQNIWDRDPG